MAQQSKFSGVLSKLRDTPVDQSGPPAPAVLAPAKGRGRPPGKRSDPAFKPTTLLLRQQTKRTAMRLLEDAQTGQDLSDLVEQLLGQWVKAHL